MGIRSLNSAASSRPLRSLDWYVLFIPRVRTISLYSRLDLSLPLGPPHTVVCPLLLSTCHHSFLTSYYILIPPQNLVPLSGFSQWACVLEITATLLLILPLLSALSSHGHVWRLHRPQSISAYMYTPYVTGRSVTTHKKKAVSSLLSCVFDWT